MSSGGAALDMTLDDIIKQNKKSAGGGSRGGGRGGRGSGGPGPSRRPFPNRVSNRSAPYAAAKAPESSWNHDMFASDQAIPYSAQAGGGRASSIETGTKLYISNLDYGVSNEDIKELFAEVGDIKRSTIHYDRSGRSKGTAEVVFSRRPDAVAAVKRYNNVQLDGKPMKIEIVGTNIVTAAAAAAAGGPAFTNGAFGDFNGPPRSSQGRGGSFGRPRGGGGRGRGFGRGQGRGRGGDRGRGEKISAEDLDADLEKYHKESMEIS